MSTLSPHRPAGTAAVPLEFLSFTLGSEEYGVDIEKVQELRGYGAVTRVADAPDYIKGVVNLRGVSVPIIDMRLKLGLGTPSYDQFTAVIILTVRGSVMGMVVDSVSDVATLAPEQIKPPPARMAQGANYLIGIGTLEQRMLILIDVDSLLSDTELAFELTAA